MAILFSPKTFSNIITSPDNIVGCNCYYFGEDDSSVFPLRDNELQDLLALLDQTSYYPELSPGLNAVNGKVICQLDFFSDSTNLEGLIITDSGYVAKNSPHKNYFIQYSFPSVNAVLQYVTGKVPS